jgi:hypothetical protein
MQLYSKAALCVYSLLKKMSYDYRPPKKRRDIGPAEQI